MAARRPVHDFYDMVQGRKNPAMICQCLKTGIGGKSGDHRTIYKACDVGITINQQKYEYCSRSFAVILYWNELNDNILGSETFSSVCSENFVHNAGRVFIPFYHV